MQDEYEAHGCFSREASIEIRECQSHELWIVVNTKKATQEKSKTKHRQLDHSTHSEAGNIQSQPFFQRPLLMDVCRAPQEVTTIGGHLSLRVVHQSHDLLHGLGIFGTISSSTT